MSRVLQNLGLIVVFGLLAFFGFIFWQQNQQRADAGPKPATNSATRTGTSGTSATTNSGSNSGSNSRTTSSNPTPKATSPGNYKVIFGEFVIKGKQPDGDSVRFKADNSSLYASLKNASRLKESADGTVQLRFEGIDAPELHYGGTIQPFSREARDKLLEWIGFRNVTYQPSNLSVTSSSPDRVRGAIMAASVEKNGRPVAYVLTESSAVGLRDGSSITVDDTRLRLTLNAQSLETGMSYFTVYSSMPEAQIKTFRALSQRARTAKLGVWARDKTNDFRLENAGSINESGQLILPKLFRRATDYLSAFRKNKTGAGFRQWLIDSVGTANPQDGLLRERGVQKRLSDLIEQNGTQIRFKADTLELVFNE
jgi:endonuclease YncB( thermonuclease family)